MGWQDAPVVDSPASPPMPTAPKWQQAPAAGGEKKEAGFNPAMLPVALAEGITSGAGSLAEAAVGGIAGLGTLAAGQGFQKGLQAVQSVAEKIPFRAETPEGKKVEEILGLLPEGIQKLGDLAFEKTKSPAIGAATQAAATAATMVLPGKLLRKGAKDATEARVVKEGDLGEHQRVDPSRIEEAKPQADRGDSAVRSTAKQEETAIVPPQTRTASTVVENLKDRPYNIKHLTEEFQGQVASDALANQRFSYRLKELVPDAKQREEVTFYLQGEKDIPLTPKMKQAADEAQEFFKGMGEKGQQSGVLEGLIDDYVTQLWTGLNKNKSIWQNFKQSMGRSNVFSGGMSPRSRFGMERHIPSYREGIQRGLIPTTLDIAEIARVYGNSVTRAIANKNFIDALKNERLPSGARAIASHDNLIADISDSMKRTDEQWQGSDEITKDIRRFANSKARNDYELVNHRQMPGMMVHKDVAPVVKWFFDAADPNAATKLAYAVSVAAKRGLFSFSFFHNASLAQSMLGAGAKAWVNVLNGKAAELLKKGKDGDVLDGLVRGGLNVTERPLEGDTTPFSNALRLLEEKNPIIGVPAKGVQQVQKAMNAFLWSTVQPTFKVATAMAALEKTLKRSPELTKEQANRVAASFTNDLFGGLDWFRIADGVQNKIGRDLALAVTSPAGRRFMQIMMLAPDWTVATARTMAKAIPGVTQREIAALHQGYVVRSALLYATVGDALNMYFSGHHFWQNADPTMVDLGDGRKLQLSKHFMEPIHWLLSAPQQAWNKLGYVPKELMEQLMNKEYVSLKRGSVEGPPIRQKVPEKASTEEKAKAMAKNVGASVEHAVGGVLPITGQQAFQQGVMPALTGFFGFPVYGSTPEQSAAKARARAEDQGKDVAKAAERARKRRQRQLDQEEANRRASQ